MTLGPNMNLLEEVQIVSGFVGDLGSGAHTADVVSMKNYRRCLILFHKAVGTVAEDPTITLLQGTSIAFTTNKALNFTSIYTKQDLTSLGDVAQWTHVTQNAANTYTEGTSGESELLWAIDVMQEDLDINSDYSCIRASVGDVGTIGVSGSLLYLLYDPVTQGAPEDMLTAIA